MIGFALIISIVYMGIQLNNYRKLVKTIINKVKLMYYYILYYILFKLNMIKIFDEIGLYINFYGSRYV